MFAAYAKVDDAVPTPEASTPQADESWLQNSSYKIDVAPSTNTTQLHPKFYDKYELCPDSDDKEPSVCTKSSTSSKKSKDHRSKSKKSAKSQDPPLKPIESGEYKIETKGTSEYFKVDTIHRPAAPRYRIYSYIQTNRPRKAKRFKRYYKYIFEKHADASNSDEEKLTRKQLNDPLTLDTREQHILDQEALLSKKTEALNKDLQADVHNIDLWLKYVAFQDDILNFEKIYKKGSIVKGQRVTAERKLSILDRALQANPDCEVLLRKRLHIAVGVFPADELQEQLSKLVAKDSDNIIWWQGYIEATQCSMSHCNTPAVIALYIKSLHTLHKLRRAARGNRGHLEESILRMLYQCGLFLRQSGLFEQLWTLMRLYLELNLSSAYNQSFSETVAMDEKSLEELEDIVLQSQLPIHELWLRVEKLREASHWLPIKDQECPDPQRLVFNEDVSELIHPITAPGNTFKLTVTILSLLKIPLLPCRHGSMQEFGIDYVPWALDSIESLLPIFLPVYPIDIRNKTLINFAHKLAVGPQYLKTLPGQEEYLQFILTIMQTCIGCLEGRERSAITVWWFRFIRLLMILEKEELFKVTATFMKKLRSDMKNVLKRTPTDIVLFKEYALVQSEWNLEAAKNVLITSLSLPSPSTLVEKPKEEQAAIVSALRALIELDIFKDETLTEETKRICLKRIIAIVLNKFNITDLPRFVTQGLINETKEKFVQINCELAENSTIIAADHFLEDYTTDWIILNAYFLLATGSISECRVYIDNVLKKWDANDQNHSENDESTVHLRKEILYEFIIALLYKTCVDTPGSRLYPTLDEYLHKAIKCYPNNLFLLATLAKMQTMFANSSKPWWRTQSLLLQSGHALPTLFLVLIVNQRSSEIETSWVDTITGGGVSTSGTLKTRTLNLFKRITRADICTRRCGLAWRLYLQFLHAHYEPRVCRDAYYLAVEECPWLKALYIDAAIYVPEDLAQIQDLIIEKQLRIHVTPEELEVLRS